MEKNDFKDYKNSSSKFYDLFIKNGENYYASYFLSSRCATCYDNAVAFRIRCIKEGSIRGDDVFDSWGGPNGMLYAFRPVVTLDSNVQLEPDGTNTWKIK